MQVTASQSRTCCQSHERQAGGIESVLVSSPGNHTQALASMHAKCRVYHRLLTVHADSLIVADCLNDLEDLYPTSSPVIGPWSILRNDREIAWSELIMPGCLPWLIQTDLVHDLKTPGGHSCAQQTYTVDFLGLPKVISLLCTRRHHFSHS